MKSCLLIDHEQFIGWITVALSICTIGRCRALTTYLSYFSSRTVELLYTEAEELAGLLWPQADGQQFRVLLVVSYYWHLLVAHPAARTV